MPDGNEFSTGWVTGEGGQQPSGGFVSAGEGGGYSGPSSPVPAAPAAPAGPAAPAPPPVRAAKNVQRANIDRSSLYDPTQTTQALGRDYLQERNASNPQPQGATGAGAVGYEFIPSNERLY